MDVDGNKATHKKIQSKDCDTPHHTTHNMYKHTKYSNIPLNV